MSETIMLQVKKMRESLGRVKKVALRSRFGLPGLRLKVASDEHTRTIRLDAFDGSSFASAWWTQGDSGPAANWNYCLDPKTLDAVLGQIDGDALTIEVQEQTVTETGKDGKDVERKQATAVIKDTNAPKKWRIALESGENFQPMPETGSWQVVPSGVDVRIGAPMVLHAAYKDDKKANLMGVRLEFVDGKMAAVATDTHRMSIWQSEDDNGYAGALILPPEMASIIGAGGFDAMRLHPEGKMAALSKESSSDGYTLLCPLFDAKEYPDWKRVIPTDEPTVTLEINAETMKDALAAVGAVATPMAQGVDLEFDGKCEMRLKSEAGENRADTAIPVEVLLGDGVEFSVILNRTYLGEFLTAVTQGRKNEGVKFKFSWRADQEPILLWESKLLDLIMPMKR